MVVVGAAAGDFCAVLLGAHSGRSFLTGGSGGFSSGIAHSLKVVVLVLVLVVDWSYQVILISTDIGLRFTKTVPSRLLFLKQVYCIGYIKSHQNYTLRKMLHEAEYIPVAFPTKSLFDGRVFCMSQEVK